MNGKPDTVVFRMGGTPADGGLVRLQDFISFCKSIEAVLHETDLAISDGAPPLQFKISDMKCGSAVVEVGSVRPKKGRDRGASVFRVVRSTFAKLERGERPDSRLSPKAIQAYRNVAKPIQRSIGRPIEQQQSIGVDGIELTSAFIANIDKLRKKTVRSMGSFSGELEQINLHNKSEFVVFPKVGKAKIVCHFPDSLLETVRAGIKRHVTVHGWMHYLDDSPYPVRAEVTQVTIHDTADMLPTLAKMAGRLMKHGDSVALVRALRDE